VSRDITVYARKKETVSIDEILLAVRARQLPVEWRSGSARKSAPTAWRTGDFRVEGRSIETYTRPLTKRHVRDASTAYDAVLSESQREALKAAQRAYMLSASGSSGDDALDRALLHVADVIAELADGIIVDTQANRFYNLTEFRSRFPHLAQTHNE